jgi:hypothetical protein
MTVRIIRLRSLYNIPARAAQPACAGKPAVKARAAPEPCVVLQERYPL